MPQAHRLAYNINEAAGLLGVGRDAIYDAIRDGNLAARKLGRRTIIPAKALADFVDSLDIPSSDDLARHRPKKALAKRAAKREQQPAVA